MAGVSDYIDEHFDDTLGKLSAWCSQPSVSTEGLGVEAMAELAAATLLQSGFEVAVHATQGYPIILADTGPSDAPAILIYNHYDVQPVGDPAERASDPFAPGVRPGKMYARGVADTKSNIVARLDALNAVRAARGTL